MSRGTRDRGGEGEGKRFHKFAPMAVTNQVAEVLFYAKSIGVSYSKSLTLGRLDLYANEEHIRQNIKDFFPSAQPESSLFDSKYSEPLFSLLGSEQTDSLDFSDYEGASIIHDLNKPLAEEHHGKYSMVLDGGTLEHVFNFPVAIQSCINALAVGGHFIGITPINNQMGHGFYQYSPELYYRIFSPENGFEVTKMLIKMMDQWYEVSDPAEVKSRVQLVNNLPIMLIVIVQKKENRSEFVVPQQSDYVSAWDALGSEGGSVLPKSSSNGAGGILKAIIPTRIKTIMRNLHDIIYKEKVDEEGMGTIDPKHFRKVDIKPKTP